MTKTTYQKNYFLTNCHLYHYAGNNPIKFLDFNGFTDELYFTEEDAIKAVQNYISQNYKGNEFSGVITKAAVPILSECQDNKSELLARFRKYSRVLLLILCYICVVLFFPAVKTF